MWMPPPHHPYLNWVNIFFFNCNCRARVATRSRIKKAKIKRLNSTKQDSISNWRKQGSETQCRVQVNNFKHSTMQEQNKCTKFNIYCIYFSDWRLTTEIGMIGNLNRFFLGFNHYKVYQQSKTLRCVLYKALLLLLLSLLITPDL